jgi:phage shock protein A
MKYQEMEEKVLTLEAQLRDIEASLKTITTEVGTVASQSEVAETIATLNTYVSTLRSATRLAKKLGLPEEFNQVITEIQRVLRLVTALKIAYAALSVVMAAADPSGISLIKAGIAVGNVIVNTAAVSG